MEKRKWTHGLAWAGLIGLLGLIKIQSIFGEGDSLIRGIGNSGNHLHFNPILDKLPAAIAANASIPAITDELLVETFEAVLTRAREGDIEAAMIVFKVAEIQKQ